jgi:hypothetical protein
MAAEQVTKETVTSILALTYVNLHCMALCWIPDQVLLCTLLAIASWWRLSRACCSCCFVVSYLELEHWLNPAMPPRALHLPTIYCGTNQYLP